MGPNSQRSSELSHRHTGSPNGRLTILGLLKSTSNEDFSEQVAQCNVAATLQRKVNTSLHKLCFPGRHCLVEAHKVTLANAIAQGTEELL